MIPGALKPIPCRLHLAVLLRRLRQVFASRLHYRLK